MTKLSSLTIPALPSLKNRLETLDEIGQASSSALATIRFKPTHSYDIHGSLNILNAGVCGWLLVPDPFWYFNKNYSGADVGQMSIHLKPPAGTKFLTVSLVGADYGTATLVILNADQTYTFTLPNDVFTVVQPLLLKSNDLDVYIINDSGCTELDSLAVDFS